MKRVGRLPIKGEDACTACEVQEGCDKEVAQILHCTDEILDSLLEPSLREILAKFIHEDIWSHWMKYLFSKALTTENADLTALVSVIGPEDRERWMRQMETPYEDLPEEEKKSDRDLADKLLRLLEE